MSVKRKVKFTKGGSVLQINAAVDKGLGATPRNGV